MKKSILIFLILVYSVVSWAQLVTTNPPFVTQDNGVTEITVDAASTDGNLGLKGYSGDVYAHVGVITSASTSTADWKYVVTPWPSASNLSLANTTKNKLTSLGNDKWKLTISPDIRNFFGVPAGETILKIALVFRNADGTLQEKTATGGDILVDLVSSGLNVAFINPSTNQSVASGTVLNLQIASSTTSNLNLLVNGSTIATATGATSLNYSYTFTSAIDYTLIAHATSGSTTVADTVYVCVPAPVTHQVRPVGVKDGINYIDNTTATLVLYAPGKSNVFLLGEFNNWTQKNAYQLNKDGDYWWYTLIGLTPGKVYGFQYLVDGKLKVSDPYTEMVLDPWNDKYIPSTIYPTIKTYPVGKTDGLVATLQTVKPTYNWEVPTFAMPPAPNMVIYELLLRDFTTEKSLNAAITKLDYLSTLGITAIELLPIQEFDGNNSWGYNPNHYFAPDKAYGTADTYKKFIDECHKRGIAVILDMVFNQASGSCPFAQLYWDAINNRPATNNPWMNPVAPHPYSVFNDFNHSFTGTKEYFKRVLQYWITEYKVDGYRMDLSKGFTQNQSSESTASNYDQTRIDNLSAYYDAAKAVKNDVMFILELFTNNSEETVLANKGMYLWRNVTNSYSQAAMGYQDYSDFSAMISTPQNWVGYAESHDEERNFFKVKTYGAGNLITDSVARVKRVPLVIAFNALLPGPKMIWEFGELGYDYSINSLGGRTNEKPSAFGWLNISGRNDAYTASAKIINLRKQFPLAFMQGNFTLNISSNDWPGRSFTLTHSDLNMVVLGNFDAVNSTTVNVTFPKAGTWYNLLTGNRVNVTNLQKTVSIKPGDLQMYTDRKITFPKELMDSTIQTDLKVYPSITHGKVYLSTSDNNVRLYNSQGTLLMVGNEVSEINLTGYGCGIYILNTNSALGNRQFKIIKY